MTKSTALSNTNKYELLATALQFIFYLLSLGSLVPKLFFKFGQLLSLFAKPGLCFAQVVDLALEIFLGLPRFCEVLAQLFVGGVQFLGLLPGMFGLLAVLL